MTELIIGTSAYDHADSQLMRSAGIQWVRVGFPYPFQAPGDSTPSPEYLKARQSARDWARQGFRLIGSTPGLGLGTFQPDAKGKMTMSFKNGFPAWYGAPGSEDFYRNYASMCAFLAKDVGDIVPLWQVANEIDWPQFAGPFNLRQASELVLRTAIAMKEVNPALMVSTNCAGTPTSYYFLGRLFDDPRVKLDYCGIDQYYGTWQPGGPENWYERIAELYAITGGVKVLVNEWGFSSAGEVMTPADMEIGVSQLPAQKVDLLVGRRAQLGHPGGIPAPRLRGFRRAPRQAAGNLLLPLGRPGDLLAVRRTRLPGRDRLGAGGCEREEPQAIVLRVSGGGERLTASEGQGGGERASIQIFTRERRVKLPLHRCSCDGQGWGGVHRSGGVRLGSTYRNPLHQARRKFPRSDCQVSRAAAFSCSSKGSALNRDRSYNRVRLWRSRAMISQPTAHGAPDGGFQGPIGKENLGYTQLQPLRELSRGLPRLAAQPKPAPLAVQAPVHVSHQRLRRHAPHPPALHPPPGQPTHRGRQQQDEMPKRLHRYACRAGSSA